MVSKTERFWHNNSRCPRNGSKKETKHMVQKMLKMKNKKGFTLIELIVVIAILGILALIAIPRLGGFTTNAQAAADKASANVVLRAWQAYEAAHDGNDPPDATALSNLVDSNDIAIDATVFGAITTTENGDYTETLTFNGVTAP